MKFSTLSRNKFYIVGPLAPICYFALKFEILCLDFVLVLICIFLGFLVFKGTGALADFFGGLGVADFFAIAFFARFAGLPLAPISAPLNKFRY